MSRGFLGYVLVSDAFVAVWRGYLRVLLNGFIPLCISLQGFFGVLPKPVNAGSEVQYTTTVDENSIDYADVRSMNPPII